MRKITFMIVPDGAVEIRRLRIPQALVTLCFLSSFVGVATFGYFIVDYVHLRSQRETFQRLTNENDGLKGEAQLLMANLEQVKHALRRVQDYTSKLGDLTKARVEQVSQKTGIGPLTDEEYAVSTRQPAEIAAPRSNFLPLGINLDTLVFRPTFDRIASIDHVANKQAFEIQKLLSTLSQQKSLLQAIPSINPVNGWITSGFGSRVSPFTGRKAAHKGIDVAAPIGTPIFAPADGVVVFTGAKAGFGNFVMIAHGYGLVTRYGHNSEIMVQVGQKVQRGEQIATVGMSGRTTGPHLHFEILVNGREVNPRKFILELNSQLTL